MAKYKVTGYYTISFEMEIEADSRAEAEETGYNLNIEEDWMGQSVFTDDDAKLNADGIIFDVNAELLEGEEDE